MSKQILTVDLTGSVELVYDPNSKEFKEALEGFNEIISSNSDANDMLKHVAFYLTRFGTGLVEGVGYVDYVGTKETEDPDSGIRVAKGFDDFEFEIN